MVSRGVGRVDYWVTVYLLGVLAVLVWQLAEYFNGYEEIGPGPVILALMWPIIATVILIALLYVLVDADLRKKPWRRPK